MRSTPFPSRYCAAGVPALMLPAGEMWSVVTESPSSASTLAPVMSVTGGGLGGHAVEVRGLAHVGRLRIPVERLAVRGRQVPPALVALEDVGVAVGEHLLVDRAGDDVGDLLRRRPDVLEEDVVAVVVLAERLGLEVEVHGAGERVGDDQRRGRQVVHLHVGGDAALEVAVTREHRGDREVVVVDGLARSPPAADRCCRCRWCSRSPPGRSPASPGRARLRPCRSSR